MTQAYRPEPSITAAQRAFHAVVVAVGGLYIATHSISVTAIGTTAKMTRGVQNIKIARPKRDTSWVRSAKSSKFVIATEP